MGVRRKKDIKITEKVIQKVLEKWYLTNPEYLTENLYVFDWESDFLAKTKSGYWYEVEIKISLSDFKNDKKNKKKKFLLLEESEDRISPNYFSYCVPDDLVEKVKDLIPPYAGLYSTDGVYLKRHKEPQKINNKKLTDEELNLVKKFYYNWVTAKEKIDSNLIEELRNDIKWLKAEFEAATGYSINEMF